MKAQDLRIGNWISNKKGEFEKVELLINGGINGYYSSGGFSPDSEGDFKPIKMSDEWAVKWGYENMVELSTCFEDKSFVMIDISLSNMYVHQVQNLYYALTGEELKEV